METPTPEMRYSVYMTDLNDESRQVLLLAGVEQGVAHEVAFTLNEGGWLRKGAEAHFVQEDES